ncbi:putative transcription factor p65 homolog isoform X2 [Apostichopus japonicus]|uniref:putative transcription factor p65 homolog isoform X2 n=1 Tax=Stichopus japonicus TaxID=307972 RepID=UPI003AB85352
MDQFGQVGGHHSIAYEGGMRLDDMNLQDWTGKNNLIENIFASMDSEPAIPCLVITEQPKPKDHRFRYPCEGRTAGALLGEKSSERKKTCPEVKVENLATRALIVGSLVTKEEDAKPHPFKLVGTNCTEGIVKMVVTASSPKAKFESLGIQCVKKADLKDALLVRKKLQVDPYNNIDQCLEDDMQDLDCKVLRICFQAYLEDPNTGQFTEPLTPVLTHNIYNKKDSNLKIMKMNKREGTAKGGDEVYIFCEKVDKEDIQVVFFEESKESRPWTDNGLFGSSDVHHQIAIVLRTPPYKCTNIEKEIEVKVRLQRTSDSDVSDPEVFTYIPENADPEQLEAKRKRNNPSFEQNFALEDGAAGSSSKLSDIKKKLNEKLKAKGRRQSLKARAQVKPESSFSFPSAADSCNMISVTPDSIAHVTIGPVKREPSAMVIPDSFMFADEPAMDNYEFSEVTDLNTTLEVDPFADLNNPTNLNFVDLPVAYNDSANTNLSNAQLVSLFNDYSEPTLAQYNNMGNNEIGLPSINVFMQDINQSDFLD